MPYVTLPQLAELPGALELAQVASDAHQGVVDAALMELTLLGGDRSSYEADLVAAADQAKARIVQAILEADGLIDGYLGKRYTLPLPSPPGILVTWARAIARYKLHQDRISNEQSDPIARDYRDALKFLREVAKGDFSLGLEDPESQALGEGEIRIDAGKKVFGRDHLP